MAIIDHPEILNQPLILVLYEDSKLSFRLSFYVPPYTLKYDHTDIH